MQSRSSIRSTWIQLAVLEKWRYSLSILRATFKKNVTPSFAANAQYTKLLKRRENTLVTLVANIMDAGKESLKHRASKTNASARLLENICRPKIASQTERKKDTLTPSQTPTRRIWLLMVTRPAQGIGRCAPEAALPQSTHNCLLVRGARYSPRQVEISWKRMTLHHILPRRAA